MNNPMDSDTPKITHCIAWIVLSRAMCIIDHESRPIEESTSMNFGHGKLKFTYKELSEAKEIAEDHTVPDSVKFLSSLDDGTRAKTFLGLICIALSDEKLHKNELLFIDYLSNSWNLGKEIIKDCCIKARVLVD
jgi:hypothetical protein